MKKTTSSNPLKTFNDNKALAIKKIGGAQTSFKKSLPKAQVGIVSKPVVSKTTPKYYMSTTSSPNTQPKEVSKEEYMSSTSPYKKIVQIPANKTGGAIPKAQFGGSSEKRAERKITRVIKKSVKNSGKKI